jgi:hypothetical protein
MRARTWVAFIVTNIVVSAAVMLTVLFVWDRLKAPPTATPVLTLSVTEGAMPPPTAIPVSSPTPSHPLEYVVQEGDTLSAIAEDNDVSIEALMAANGITDPNLLHVGQKLVIPFPTPAPSSETVPASPPEEAPSPSASPPPTLTPSGPSLIEIGQVLGPGDLAAEVVVIRNLGGAVSLEGWALSDAEDNVFTFPMITIYADAQIRVYTKPGRSTPSDLYWGREIPAWNSGELITLRNEMGSVVDTTIVP